MVLREMVVVQNLKLLSISIFKLHELPFFCIAISQFCNTNEVHLHEFGQTLTNGRVHYNWKSVLISKLNSHGIIIFITRVILSHIILHYVRIGLQHTCAFYKFTFEEKKKQLFISKVHSIWMTSVKSTATRKRPIDI